MVGARGLEPPTSRSRTVRSTRLSYAPICCRREGSRQEARILGEFAPSGQTNGSPRRFIPRDARRPLARGIAPGRRPRCEVHRSNIHETISVILALLALALPTLRAGQPSRFEEQIDVNAVLLDVIVTDPKGNQILGLSHG